MDSVTAQGLGDRPGASHSGDAAPFRKSLVERHRRLFQVVFWAAVAATLVTTKPSIHNTYAHGLVNLVAYGLVTAATAGRLWCNLYIRGRKSKSLCQDGPYSVCRNPLYLFSFLGVSGVALASDRLVLMILLPGLFSGYYLAVIKCEEKRLLALFGRDYETYRARVPRILPRFQGYSTPATVAMPVDQYLPGIMKSMGYLWILFLLELVEALAPVL
jgi:protein-S-isoprenylcysteine O-methyltransferase Ste14